MKNSSRYPKEVQQVVRRINDWIENNVVEYDCDPVVLREIDYSDFDYVTGKGKRTREYILCSNYEDGFSCAVYRDGKWYRRGYMSELPDRPVAYPQDPAWLIIGIMAG